MNLYSTKCPECGAPITFKGNSNKCFCAHCGLEINKEENTININKNTTYRKIDEAKIKRVEFEREKDREDRNLTKLSYFLVAGFASIAIVAFIIFGYTVKSDSDKRAEEKAIYEASMEEAGMIKLPNSHGYYEDRNYKVVEAEFAALGFTNIELIDLGDVLFFSKDHEMVESVSIAGDSGFYYNDYFSPDDKVIISYH